MEAIILAGGLGTRLKKVIHDVPKPMAPIGDKPFLEILLNMLSKKGFTRIIISIGYMAEKISEYFGLKFMGMEIHYVFEDKPLGTGGATKLALSSCNDDHAYIFNGDTYIDIDIELLEKTWLIKKIPIVVGVEVENTERYGRLKIENNKVIDFNEKGVAGKGLINAGCYVIPKDALNNLPENIPFPIETKYLKPAIKKSSVELFLTNSIFIDIGVPDDYNKAQSILSSL